MASTNDIRDIMDMGRDGPKSSGPKKKKKIIEHLPRHSGLSREVQALMGDSVPPVAIVEGPKYKSKPSLATRNFKPRHWEERSFEPRARNDGLVLRHWKRARVGQRPSISTATPAADVEMADDETNVAVGAAGAVEMLFEDEFPMDKWNVQLELPSYTDEQYDNHFKSEDWTREETDYLLQLASDYGLRWMLIADRYSPDAIPVATPDSEEPADGTEVAKSYPERNMEALKSRYYQVAAKDLELKTPASNMTQTEFQLWEKMKNFDAKTEMLRKNMAAKLFERTKDEADEERTLLEELHRITKNEEDFIRMRKDLYSRLESVPSLRRNERGEEANIALYQTSAGLTHLFQNLLKKEQRLKRPTLPNGEATSATAATPVDGRGRHAGQISRRDTMDSHAPDSAHPKKGSISLPVVKQLTPAEEAKYGVSHPTERLSSGVSFRHEKINRITTAKSQVQTQKLNAALTELEIPPRLSMPTERVCREFERLVHNIQLLLDARKTLSRVMEEVKVLEEVKRQRLGLPPNDDQQQINGTEAMEVDKATDEFATSDVNKRQPEASENRRLKATNADEKDGDENDEDEEDDKGNESMAKTERDKDEDDEEDEDADEDKSEAVQDEEEEEDEGEDGENEVSFSQRDQDDDEDDEDQDDEEEDDDADVQAVNHSIAASDEEDAEEEEEQEEDQEEAESGNEEEEEEEEEEVDVTAVNGDDDGASEDNEDEDDQEEDNEDEDEEPEPPSRPTSSGSAVARSHKRSASVISDASKTGSNRSGIGRKRKK